MKTFSLQSLIHRSSLLLATAAASWLLGMAAMGDDSSPPAKTHPMSSSYKVLLERSVFSRDNRPAPVNRPAPTTNQATVVDSSSFTEAEANFILTGVALEDDQPTAFFEQTSEKRFVRKHCGEPVAHGVVSAISLDGIEYAANGKSSHVCIGQTLDGGTVAVSTPSPSSTSSAVPERPAGEKPSWWRKSKESKDGSSGSGSEKPEKKHKHDHDPDSKSSKKSAGF